MCPKGDDPWTLNQNNRQIQLIVFSNNSDIGLVGSVGITLYGVTTFIPVNTSSVQCKQALENSTQIGTVDCYYNMISSYELEMIITFTSWPLYTPDNNIFVNNGNPLITDFYCDASLLANSHGIHCTFQDIQNENIKGKFFIKLYYFLIWINYI